MGLCNGTGPLIVRLTDLAVVMTGLADGQSLCIRNGLLFSSGGCFL
jgi:hypothetical protein